MSFLNGILLGGLAAFSIPLIIHILNKRRFKTVHWGAMHLIAPLMKKNNQRIRLEQLLLLLMRIAIPILLALCLARPVLTGMKKFKGNEKTSTVFVIDNSFSMQDGTAAQSNFARAREEITKTIENMPRGSDAAVVLMGGRPEPLLGDPTTSLEDVVAGLRETNGASGPAKVAEAIQGSIPEFDKMSHGAREVIFVSDFQAGDWKDAAASARRNAMDGVYEMGVVPNITLFRVADGSGENVSITSVDVSSLVLGAGQKFSLRANLENHGETSYPDLMVFFRVNGEEKRSSQITLAPGQEAQVLFTHTFETPGSHHVEISTEADSLRADNSFTAAFSVWDEVPVLLVDGAPSDEPLEGETDFLQIALQPFGSAEAALSDLVTSETVRPDELGDNRLEGKRVVILANVKRLHNHQLEQLEKFVADGGGLIVFPGDEIEPLWYNADFFKGGKGLLPQQYVDLAGVGGAGAGGARPVDASFEHPALAFFNDPRNGKLSGAEFRSWFKMDLLDSARDQVPASLSRDLVTLARLDTSDALLVERPFGEGRVLQCAAPADADWGNLPTQPVYLPLMQRLVTYLAASVEPPRNLDAGAKLVALLPAELAGETAVVENPAGVQHEVAITREGSRAMAEFTETEAPGIYTLTAPDADATTYHFAVNLDRDESQLATLNDEEMKELADEMDASLVTSFEDYKSLDRERRFGIEFWKPLLIALVAFLFLELLYQQWISRRRSV